MTETWDVQRKEHARDTGFGAKTDEPSKNELEPESVGGIKTVRALSILSLSSHRSHGMRRLQAA